jgi:hypothetical protein
MEELAVHVLKSLLFVIWAVYAEEQQKEGDGSSHVLENWQQIIFIKFQPRGFTVEDLVSFPMLFLNPMTLHNNKSAYYHLSSSKKLLTALGTKTVHLQASEDHSNSLKDNADTSFED